MQIKGFKQINNLLGFNFFVKVEPKILNDLFTMNISILTFRGVSLELKSVDELLVENFVVLHFRLGKFCLLPIWVNNQSLDVHDWALLLFEDVVEDFSWNNTDILILW